MSVLQKVTITSPFGESDECAAFTLTNALETYTLFDVCDVGREYVFSFWLKSAAAGSLAVLGQSIVSSATWTEHAIRYVAQSKNLVLDFNAAGTYYIYHAQNELGNQQTDYSEAPEDAEERLGTEIEVTAKGLRAEITRTSEELGTEITRLGVEAGELKIEVGTKVTQADVDKSIGAIDEFHGTTVDITGNGFAIKTGGTFTVDSKKFDIDENGEMSAVNARISGQLSVDGNDVWHKGALIVSTATPSNPAAGMIWVKPDLTAIPAAGTWSLAALTSRPDKWTSNYDYALSGTNIGAAPSNATYTYEVSVPVYYGYNGSGACNVTVYLGASSGATTISMGTRTFSDTNKGGNMYTATVTSGTWLGNAGTIYMRVNFSAPNLMTVNSHSPFTCTLTAKSSTATGWKVCEVQMYTG